jgi:hypothetical protein
MLKVRSKRVAILGALALFATPLATVAVVASSQSVASASPLCGAGYALDGVADVKDGSKVFGRMAVTWNDSNQTNCVVFYNTSGSPATMSLSARDSEKPNTAKGKHSDSSGDKKWSEYAGPIYVYSPNCLLFTYKLGTWGMKDYAFKDAKGKKLWCGSGSSAGGGSSSGTENKSTGSGGTSAGGGGSSSGSGSNAKYDYKAGAKAISDDAADIDGIQKSVNAQAKSVDSSIATLKGRSIALKNGKGDYSGELKAAEALAKKFNSAQATINKAVDAAGAAKAAMGLAEKDAKQPAKAAKAAKAAKSAKDAVAAANSALAAAKKARDGAKTLNGAGGKIASDLRVFSACSRNFNPNSARFCIINNGSGVSKAVTSAISKANGTLTSAATAANKANAAAVKAVG